MIIRSNTTLKASIKILTKSMEANRTRSSTRSDKGASFGMTFRASGSSSRMAPVYARFLDILDTKGGGLERCAEELLKMHGGDKRATAADLHQIELAVLYGLQSTLATDHELYGAVQDAYLQEVRGDHSLNDVVNPLQLWQQVADQAEEAEPTLTENWTHLADALKHALSRDRTVETVKTLVIRLKHLVDLVSAQSGSAPPAKPSEWTTNRAVMATFAPMVRAFVQNLAAHLAFVGGHTEAQGLYAALTEIQDQGGVTEKDQARILTAVRETAALLGGDEADQTGLMSQGQGEVNEPPASVDASKWFERGTCHSPGRDKPGGEHRTPT